MTPDERYLTRLRRAAERLRRLASRLEGGHQDEQGLLALESHIGTLTYYVNLAHMQAATHRPETHDETTLDADRAVALRRAS